MTAAAAPPPPLKPAAMATAAAPAANAGIRGTARALADTDAEADALFQQHSVAEIRAIERRTRYDRPLVRSEPRLRAA